MTEDDWDFQHDINLKASFFLCRAAGRAMAAQGAGGRIITFTSQAWAERRHGRLGRLRGDQGRDRDHAARAGADLGAGRDHRQHHLAGLVETPMITTASTRSDVRRMRSQVLLGRTGQPDDIAPVAVFLASDHARYITGATINVRGGMLLY